MTDQEIIVFSDEEKQLLESSVSSIPVEEFAVALENSRNICNHCHRDFVKIYNAIDKAISDLECFDISIKELENLRDDDFIKGNLSLDPNDYFQKLEKTVSKFDFQDIDMEISTLVAKHSSRIQDTFGQGIRKMCAGVKRAIAELSNKNNHKFDPIIGDLRSTLEEN